MRRYKRKDPWTRFMLQVRKSVSGCWLWQGFLNHGGYGQFWTGERFIGPHRFAYMHEVGQYDQSLDLDHLCRVRHCVNPQHLEPVTRRENLKRGIQPRGNMCAAERQLKKTHCPNGHPYSGNNVYFRAKPKGRICRACHRDRTRVRRAKQNAKV